VDSFENPTVRGERVTIKYEDNGDTCSTPTALNAASWPRANVLVVYPDGELGYVREEDISEG